MKSVARLTGSLLVRKGYAAPSQTIAAHNGQVQSEQMQANAAFANVHSLQSDLPNASATAPTVIHARAPKPAPVTPRIEAAPKIEAAPQPVAPQKRTAAAEEALKPTPNTEAGIAGQRVAMTLRLDHERHLKLRVFSAHSNLSSQEILTAALDDYLERHASEPDFRHCECLQKGIAPKGCC